MSLTAWQAGVLREMGLAPLWRLRSEDVAEAETAPPPVAAPPATADAVAAAAPAALPRTVAAYLPPLQPPPSPAAEARSVSPHWQERHHYHACGLRDLRRQSAEADADTAQWMVVVGERPGEPENEQGLPFAGKRGSLLDQMLAYIDLARSEQPYISNVVEQGQPLPHDEAPAAGHQWLRQQIAGQRPRLILALGHLAVQALLDEPLPINANRLRFFPLGSAQEGGGTAVLLSYHPSYLLRNPADKARAWEDLCFFREQMDRLA